MTESLVVTDRFVDQHIFSNDILAKRLSELDQARRLPEGVVGKLLLGISVLWHGPLIITEAVRREYEDHCSKVIDRIRTLSTSSEQMERQISEMKDLEVSAREHIIKGLGAANISQMVVDRKWWPTQSAEFPRRFDQQMRVLDGIVQQFQSSTRVLQDISSRLTTASQGLQGGSMNGLAPPSYRLETWHRLRAIRGVFYMITT